MGLVLFWWFGKWHPVGGPCVPLRHMVMIQEHAAPRVLGLVARPVQGQILAKPNTVARAKHDQGAVLRRRLNALPFAFTHRFLLR